MRLALIACLLVLAACDMRGVYARTAREVVRPVMDTVLPPAQAEIATLCVVSAATPEELQLLARDVGNRAGSTALQVISSVSARPEAQRCFLAGGVTVTGLAR